MWTLVNSACSGLFDLLLWPVSGLAAGWQAFYLGIPGALLALAVYRGVSNQEGIPLLDLLSRLDLEIVGELMMATFSPFDLLFYGIAMYQGYKFSFRPLSPKDLGLPSEE